VDNAPSGGSASIAARGVQLPSGGTHFRSNVPSSSRSPWTDVIGQS
jgi:hypothetical protein